MNQVIKCLMERRSVRNYSERIVPEETVNLIMEAGKYAPSGMGLQGTMMVAVQNSEIIKKLSAMNAEIMGKDTDPFYGAGTCVIVFADENIPTYVENGSLVMGNLMNAAFSLGVDSCWIHRCRQMFESHEGRLLKEQWGIPENYVGIGNCILGYHQEEYPEPAKRKENFVTWVK